MLFNILLLIFAGIFALLNEGFWPRTEFILLGIMGILISIIEYNRGWNTGFNEFMKEFARNSNLSVVRDLFRKEKEGKNEKK